MLNVDSEDKSEKTLKTEELEVLVRLLNSNLESLRYLRQESSIEKDVALNNRLLTARQVISALSGLITFLSEGEIAQICDSNVSRQETASRRPQRSGPYTTVIPRETAIPLEMSDKNVNSLIDDDEDEDDEEEEGDYDDDDEEEEGDYDDDDDDDDDEHDEEESANAERELDPVHSPKPRPPMFQRIRPLMEVLRTGIQGVPPTTLHTNFKHNNPIFYHPRNDHANGSVNTTKNRSEYEMGNISSIDHKRRPVVGIPAPILPVPRGALVGGGGPRRGNLNDLKRSRRPLFLSQTRMSSTPSADVPSSVDDVRDNPRKRRLEDDDDEEDYRDDDTLVEYKRRHVLHSLSMEPRPLTSRPTRTQSHRKTTSKWKARRTKLSTVENKNKYKNIALHPFSTSCSSSSSSDIALSTASMFACSVPGSSTSNALILNPLLPTRTQLQSEDASLVVDGSPNLNIAATIEVGQEKAREDENSHHTPLHEEDPEKSNFSLPFPSPPSLDMPPSASDPAVIASGTDNTETDTDEASFL